MFKSFCVVLVYVFGLQTFKSFCVVSVSVCLLALLNVQIILCSLQTMQNVLPNGWLTLRKMTLTSCKVSFPSVIVFLPPALTLQPANGLKMLNCYKAAGFPTPKCGGWGWRDFPPQNIHFHHSISLEFTACLPLLCLGSKAVSRLIFRQVFSLTSADHSSDDRFCVCLRALCMCMNGVCYC